ncbi:hypothetical protein DRW03_11160 [Corallococcus sp. H22C18031201]|uniref:hypothetical protein n=1 Tax=Citreicoccus inhibens TaxID=2849499 RepID=UPI000E742E03|nr:hypothetical protein [Citreicoccus inhibens]MBU8898783.1 hypothetical protein [Citreicoccus inhibens]RJS24155.1 hypothetical protein DRW03_11160 [Corallococcus sp. H22C18031201]
MRVRDVGLVVMLSLGGVACVTATAPSEGAAVRGAADTTCKATTTACDGGTCAFLRMDENSAGATHFKPECLAVQQDQTLIIENDTDGNRCVNLPAIFVGVTTGCVQVNAHSSWQGVVSPSATVENFALTGTKGDCQTGCPASISVTINGSLDVTSKGGEPDGVRAR